MDPEGLRQVEQLQRPKSSCLCLFPYAEGSQHCSLPSRRFDHESKNQHTDVDFDWQA